MSDKCEVCDQPALPTPWRIYWRYVDWLVTSADYSVCSEECGDLLSNVVRQQKTTPAQDAANGGG